MAKVRRYSAMPLPVLFSSAVFACAITSPSAGASVTQGTPVNITGTLTAPAVVVQVKLGSTVIGSASIVGLNWSFSWTPQAGDVGAQTINAVATNANSAQATAAGVNVTVASSGFGGNFGALVPGVSLYLRGDLGLHTTSTVVNTWDNQAGAATNTVEKTAGVGIGTTGAGVGGRASVVQNGSSQAGSHTLAHAAPGTTPTFIYIISKQLRTSVAGQPQRILSTAGDNTFLLYQDQNSDNLKQFGDTGSQTVTPAITHVWARTALLFVGGTGDTIKWGNYAAVTGTKTQNAAAGSSTRWLGFDTTSGVYNQGEFTLILEGTAVNSGNFAATLAALDAAADSWFGNVLM